MTDSEAETTESEEWSEIEDDFLIWSKNLPPWLSKASLELMADEVKYLENELEEMHENSCELDIHAIKTFQSCPFPHESCPYLIPDSEARNGDEYDGESDKELDVLFKKLKSTQPLKTDIDGHHIHGCCCESCLPSLPFIPDLTPRDYITMYKEKVTYHRIEHIGPIRRMFNIQKQRQKVERKPIFAQFISDVDQSPHETITWERKEHPNEITFFQVASKGTVIHQKLPKREKMTVDNKTLQTVLTLKKATCFATKAVPPPTSTKHMVCPSIRKLSPLLRQNFKGQTSKFTLPPTRSLSKNSGNSRTKLERKASKDSKRPVLKCKSPARRRFRY